MKNVLSIIFAFCLISACLPAHAQTETVMQTSEILNGKVLAVKLYVWALPKTWRAAKNSVSPISYAKTFTEVMGVTYGGENIQTSYPVLTDFFNSLLDPASIDSFVVLPDGRLAFEISGGNKPHRYRQKFYIDTKISSRYSVGALVQIDHLPLDPSPVVLISKKMHHRGDATTPSSPQCTYDKQTGRATNNPCFDTHKPA
jgi:hypothetical protein